MKSKLKKAIAALMAIITIFCLSAFLVSAYEEPEAKSLYYRQADTLVSISSSGLLTITNSYSIKSSAFTSAKISTYVERRVLGLFWVKVDNGQNNNTWVVYPTATNYTKQHTLYLTQTGTYRVTAEFTFYGTNGTESVTRQVTAAY